MSTLTRVEQQKIADWFATHELPSGLGDAHAACSIASINLALTGRLTDDIPECMSQVIGRWLIGVQDAMPHDIRNSDEWKRLLPLAAGTGRVYEAVRINKIMNWVWTRALPELLPIAQSGGFGEAWQTMLDKKTAYAADAAYAYAADAADAYAADAADAAAYAGDAAYAYAADAAAGHAARATAHAAAAAAAYDARSQFWTNVNPCQLLAELIDTE